MIRSVARQIKYHEFSSALEPTAARSSLLSSNLVLAQMVYRNSALAPGVAFVTGGARGLGNAVAVAFAKEGAKAVVLVDINDEETMNAGKKSVEEYGAEARSTVEEHQDKLGTHGQIC